METFSALLVLCAGNSPVTGEFPSQKPVTRSFDVFWSASEQTDEYTIETLVISDASHPLWRHCNGERCVCVCVCVGGGGVFTDGLLYTYLI